MSYIHCQYLNCQKLFDAKYGVFHCSDDCRRADHRALEGNLESRTVPAPARSRTNPVDVRRARARAEVLADRAAPHPTLSTQEATLELIRLAAQKPAPRERVVRRIQAAVDDLELERRTDTDKRDHSLDFIVRPNPVSGRAELTTRS